MSLTNASFLKTYIKKKKKKKNLFKIQAIVIMRLNLKNLLNRKNKKKKMN